MGSRAAAVITAGLLAGVLATTAARPLFHADLWGHLAYGRHIRAVGAVPATEPLMPLAAGQRFVNFAWVAEVAGSRLYDAAGPEGLRLAGGLLVAAAVGLIGTAARRRGGGATGGPAWAGWVGGGVFLAAAWFQLFAFAPWADPLAPQMLRPQTVAVALFAAVLAAGSPPARPGWRWVGLPALFLLWANVHGSWLVGLAWLGAGAVGRAAPLGPAAWRSGRVRRSAGLIGLCAAVCCVNPLGPAAYAEILTFGRHPNLADVVEWQPLSWEMTQGRAFFLLAAALAALARASPRRVRFGEAAALIGFGLAACQTSRWLLWWAGPAGIFAGSHLAALARGRRSPARSGGFQPPTGGAAVGRRTRSLRREPAAGSRRYDSRFPTRAVWAGGLIAGLLASVPAWRLAAGERAGPGALAAGTPVRAAAFLRGRPPAGLIFNAHRFGDFLIFAGPPGTRVFVGSHAHLIPPRVWEDHRAISAAADGWEPTLNRYGAAALVLSPAEQPRLLAAAERSPRWREAYRDGTAVVFERAAP